MRIKDIDKSDMLGKLERFPNQIMEIINTAKAFDISKLESFRPSKIIIIGMGGSAIGGDILAELLAHETNIPILTVRDYIAPITADKGTLVFACSYSGNTEETLSILHEVKDRGCKIIGITSGGKLKEFCESNELQVLKIPTGLPPRAAVAYLFFPMLIILEKLDLIREFKEIPELVRVLNEMGDELKPSVPVDQNRGKQIAKKLSKSIPYIYGHTYLNIIARRWQNQLNENSKVLAFSSGFPEMNHNEIVGWVRGYSNLNKKFIVVFLRSADEHPRINKRLKLTIKMLAQKASDIIEVEARGANRLTRMFTTLYLGDYVSLYLALIRGIDPTPVKPIDFLKKKLNE